MQRRLVFSLVLVIGVIIVLGTAFDQRRVSPSRVDRALERGLSSIAKAHSPFHFADPYLEYMYPGEALDCGLPNCRISYRTLDAYFALAMLGPRLESNESAVIEAALAEGVNVLADLAPRWRNAPIQNALKSSASDSGVAIDTYCILGVVKQDVAMARHILSYISEDDNLIDDRYFQNDTWRNIADETWCLRLIAETETPLAQLNIMLNAQADQGKSFLASRETVSAKLAVLYHLLMLDSRARPTLPNRDLWWEKTVELLRTGAVDDDPISLGNALEALSNSGYPDQAFLRILTNHLLALQGDDGAWRTGGQYPVFTTLRALNGLAAFREQQP